MLWLSAFIDILHVWHARCLCAVALLRKSVYTMSCIGKVMTRFSSSCSSVSYSVYAVSRRYVKEKIHSNQCYAVNYGIMLFMV